MKFFILFNLIFISISSQSIDNFLKDKVFLKSLLKNNNELLRINKEIREIKVKIESIKKVNKFNYIKDNYLLSPDSSEIKINEFQLDKNEIIASQQKDIEILLKNIEILKSELKDLLQINPIETYPNITIQETAEIPTILDNEKLKFKDGIINQFEELAFLSKEIRKLGSELKYQTKLLKDKKTPGSPVLAEKDEDFQWNYFGKSLIFPAWGHSDSESQWKKYVYSGLFIACTINAIQKYNQLNRSVNEYESYNPLLYDVLQTSNRSIAIPLLKQRNYGLLRENLQDSVREANQSLYYVLFISLLSAIDAGLTKHISSDTEGINLNSKVDKITSTQIDNSIDMTYYRRF